ncbi:hypothetical protein [Pontimicrobium sp. MEBiC01747]
MKNFIYIVTLFSLISCTKNSKETLLPVRNEIIKSDIKKKKPIKTISNDIKEKTCDEFSQTMISIIDTIKLDNYKTEEFKEKLDTLFFKSYKTDLEIVDKIISFPKTQLKTILFSRKSKLKGMKGNWYPSFSITEICCKDELSASNYQKQISKIINSNDSFNEKDYDYILQNKTKLIYVNCNARIFKPFAFSYKKQIKEIIENNN